MRTIKRWRRDGLVMGVDAKGRRVVAEAALLAWFRDRLDADPVHQQRMRVVRAAEGGSCDGARGQ